jgi:chemotaxis regulatin CheY-phosphate phosphatase CheZ
MPILEYEQDYDKESVNLWVNPERKARWQGYLEEESEHQHLSQLIRQAVEREIQGETGTSANLSEDVAGHFDDLRGSIDHVEQVMQEVESRLSGFEREVRDDPAVRQLANEMFEVLRVYPVDSGCRNHGPLADGF